MRHFILIVFCLLLAFGLGPSATQGESQPKVEVLGTQSNDGVIRIAVFLTHPGFPEDHSLAAEVLQRPARSNHPILFDLKREYLGQVIAISAYHDENNNNKVDKNFLGIPIEGVGVSNNNISKLAPPRFTRAKFKCSEELIQIRLFY